MGIVVVVVVSIVVAVVMVVVMSIVVVFVMSIVVVVVMANTVVAAKALAQRQLGSQLSDGLSLVQYCLFLPHKTFTQVQDGRFGLVRHHAPPGAGIWATAVTIGGWSMGHTGRRIAARVCLWRYRSANEFGANAIVVFYARQTTCRCGT